MRRHLKAGRALRVLSASFLAGSALAGAAAAEPLSLTILHFNDFDRMEEVDGRGGFARLVGTIKAEAEDGGPQLVTFAGDLISPSLLSGFDHGAHMIALLNQVGLDIFTVGNHEFDFGPDTIRQRLAEATFPIVASNAIEADGTLLDAAVESRIIEIAGYKLGFLGLTTPDTILISSPGDITFAPIVETASRVAGSLREQGADLVIAVAHISVAEDMALLQSGAVDMILSGHDHFLISWYDGRRVLVEGSSQANYLMAVDLTMDRVGQNATFVWRPNFRSLDTGDYLPDEEMMAAVQVYLDELSSELDIAIGTTTTPIDSRRATVRGQESAMGNLIADAMRAAVDADIAITNGGGIRADRTYDAGTVLTRRDIQSELPFGNRTVKLELSGADVLAALENGFSQVEQATGRFPQVSGLTVKADLARPPGSRVVEVLIDGAPLDPAATYTLATNDFMAGGGDGYAVFVKAPQLIDASAADFMASQVMDYIDAADTVAPVVEGRITFGN